VQLRAKNTSHPHAALLSANVTYLQLSAAIISITAVVVAAAFPVL
jgi:hypothetical protein